MRKVRELYKVEFADGIKGALGIDERGQLYWNGEPVMTEQRVSLSRWLSLTLAMGGLSLFAMAALAFFIYLKPVLIIS